MKSIESEEFYNLLQQCRHMPAWMTDGTLAAYQAIIDYVDNHAQSQQEQIFRLVIREVEECFVDEEPDNLLDMTHNTTVFDCVYAIRTVQSEQFSEDGEENLK